MVIILRYDQLFIRQLPYLKNVIILSLKNSRENVVIRKEKRGISLSYNKIERNSSAFFSCLMPFTGAFPILLQRKMPPFTSRFMTKYILKDTYYYGRGVKDETCSLININDAIFLSINFIIQIKNHTFATAISKRVP